MLGGQGKGQSHRHSLRNIVERHRGHQQRGALPVGGYSLRGCSESVQVGHQSIQCHQEGHTQHKSAGRRKPTGNSKAFRLFNGRNNQRPNRGRDHHPGCKAEKNTLDADTHPLTEEKDHSRP